MIAYAPLHVPIENLTLCNVYSVPGHGQFQLIQVILRLLTLTFTS